MSPKERQEQEEKAIAEQKRIAAFVTNAFATTDGKNALEWLSKLCLEHEQTFDASSPDMTAFNEGKRFVIRCIRTVLGTRFP